MAPLKSCLSSSRVGITCLLLRIALFASVISMFILMSSTSAFGVYTGFANQSVGPLTSSKTSSSSYFFITLSAFCLMGRAVLRCAYITGRTVLSMSNFTSRYLCLPIPWNTSSFNFINFSHISSCASPYLVNLFTISNVSSFEVTIFLISLYGR